MNLEQTRQLGIEFERRIQTMIPEREFLNKLDSETIFSFLNQYQDKYIHEIYRNLDNIQSGSKISAHVESVLQSLLRTETINVDKAKDYTKNIEDINGIVIIENGRSVTYPLDPSFYMYVRSVSNVSSTYSYKGSKTSATSPIRILPNELVSQSDVWKLLETPHNSLRILRHPAASIGNYEDFVISPKMFKVVYQEDGPISFRSDKTYSLDQIIKKVQRSFPDLDISKLIPQSDDEFHAYGETWTFVLSGYTYTLILKELEKTQKCPTLNVIYDRYTTPLGIKIVYYAQPAHFDLMTSTPCELPMDAFDDLVSGAVDLYVQYAAGAEANKRRQDEAARQQAKQRQKNNDNED